MRILGWVFLFFLILAGVVIGIDKVTTTGEKKLVGASLRYNEGRGDLELLGSRKWVAGTTTVQQSRRAAVLLEDYYYCHRQSGNVMRIPRTYQTDFASLPPYARLLTDRVGDSTEPAKIHDWLYSVGEKSGTVQREEYREKADRIFLDALQDNDVGLATRTIMYLAVRLGGGAAYGRPDEWDGRFRDTESGEITEPPFDKPETAFFARIDCDDFDEEIILLAACASTDETLRFKNTELTEFTRAIEDRGWRCLDPVE